VPGPVPAAGPTAAAAPPTAAQGPAAAPGSEPGGLSRRTLFWETWFVQLAFVLPSLVSAVDMLAAHLAGSGNVSFFPTLIRGHPVENLILGGFSYLPVGAVVPLALLLLTRTGQRPADLGLAGRGWRGDLLPAAGIAAAGYGTSIGAAIALSGVLASARGLVSQVQLGHVPLYYIGYGVLVAAVTAITEETLVNGYLLTRLEQLGWAPQRALLVSLALRTSYHLYYGLGLIFTIPFGYYATRSFQKRRRLGRPVIAHFLYDAVIVTIGVLAARGR
jgi:membrane protease YdiL (CAAX protease family)